ncbi:hypothetical protein PBY51_011475 [Eleginops maclovinus]|uniref:Uncharacterized protein n=1 Tax=Eleginops maclovinus TaxID=56733 RepID=A0AAN7XUP5_ELEMC|nr:hypothetical protein PBY51_011475 [Eleginops maclovinus]
MLNRTNENTQTHFHHMHFTSHIGNSKQEDTLSRFGLCGLAEERVGRSRTGVILLRVCGKPGFLSPPPNET